ncbi:MAG: phosphotransferase family protein [Tepidiformaceae bacterium]
MVLPRDEALEERIADLALARYGHRPSVEKYHSENNYVCRLRFDGSTPDRVIKVGLHLAGAVRQEAEALHRLHAAGLEVPEVEFTDDDAPGFDHAFFVMPHLGEMDLGKACAQDLDWAEATCQRAGEFLGRLQSLPLDLLDGFAVQHYRDFNTEYPGSRWAELREIARGNHPGESFFEVVRAIVDGDLAEPGRVVVHESFIPGQVITNGGDIFGVTDWETIRSGRPLQDVSCFGAGLRAWYGGNPKYLEALIDGATGGAGFSAEKAVRCRAWQCYRLFWWAEFGLRSDREEMARALLDQAQALGHEL